MQLFTTIVALLLGALCHEALGDGLRYMDTGDGLHPYAAVVIVLIAFLFAYALVMLTTERLWEKDDEPSD